MVFESSTTKHCSDIMKPLTVVRICSINYSTVFLKCYCVKLSLVEGGRPIRDCPIFTSTTSFSRISGFSKEGDRFF